MSTKSYRAAFQRPLADQAVEPTARSSIDYYWFFRAIDHALQGKKLGGELAEAQQLTEQFMSCMTRQHGRKHVRNAGGLGITRDGQTCLEVIEGVSDDPTDDSRRPRCTNTGGLRPIFTGDSPFTCGLAVRATPARRLVGKDVPRTWPGGINGCSTPSH